VDARGGAPGTRETDLLDPPNLIQRVNAVCLTGGSAYGLAAADGVMRWLGEHNLGTPVGEQPHEVVPIVPAAALFDLPMSRWGNRPDAGFGHAACAAASAAGLFAPVAQGCVGAGTGAVVGHLKGGLGTASAVVPVAGQSYVVGAVAALNAVGDPVDQRTGLPWGVECGLPGEFDLRPVRPAEPAPTGPREGPLNTTLGVVAVDADLTKTECRRLAIAAQDGLARAVRPAHTMFDGDTVFALATGAKPVAVPPGEPGRARILDRLCVAAADVFARAMVHGLLAADPVGTLPSYRQVWTPA
jgi:L-aminopeptidase/D-esterase-like protein